MGLTFSQQNKRDVARQSFGKALELAPDQLPVLEQLVDLDLAEEQYTNALRRIESQIDKNPKQPEPRHVRLIRHRRRLGRTNDKSALPAFAGV
jgi:Tfp pilus assembly protein PilF